MPTVPTFLRSVIEAMPWTITQKITGAIIMRTSATKESPSGLSAMAVFGRKRPMRMPRTMAMRTCT